MVQSIKNIIAAVLIAVSGFVFWTVVFPGYYITSELKLKIDEKQEILVSRAELLKKIESIGSDYEDRYSEIQRLLLVVPDKKGLPEIISTMEKIFSQTGNSLEDLLISSGYKEEDILRRVSLDITSFGDYNSILNLLTILEKNIRVLDVTTLTISEDLEAPNRLSFQIKADVYWLGEPKNNAQSLSTDSDSVDN